jgi:flagellar basal body-associated protein FliL
VRAKGSYSTGDLSIVIIIGIVAAIVILGLGLFFFLANQARTRQVQEESSPKRVPKKNVEDPRATGLN